MVTFIRCKIMDFRSRSRIFLKHSVNAVFAILLFIYVWGKHIFETRVPPTGIQARDGHVAIVTGGSKGIGLEVVRQLLSHKIHTIIIASSASCGKLLENLKKEFPEAKVEYFQVDITSSQSVRKFANNFLERKLPLNLLINNAGVMIPPYKLTEEGIESQFAINYLGHFLLTFLLLPKLVESGNERMNTRIVNVSSVSQYGGSLDLDNINSKDHYYRILNYSNSKLAQVLHAISLQKLMDKRNAYVKINAVHPGVIPTDLFRYSIFKKLPFWKFLFSMTPKDGADGIIHVALSSYSEGIGGKYFENMEIVEPNKSANDTRLQEQLWKKSCEMLKIENSEF